VKDKQRERQFEERADYNLAILKSYCKNRILYTFTTRKNTGGGRQQNTE
jgi:hypothetical protein